MLKKRKTNKSSSTSTESNVTVVRKFHERTKHLYPRNYAKSADRIDWSTQPLAREFEQAPRQLLPFVSPPRESYASLFDIEHVIESKEVSMATISSFLYHSMALSAWKNAGDDERWSVRVHPSSGNLHPTESWLLTDAKLYHYVPREHAVEERACYDVDAFEMVRTLLPASAFLVALSSVAVRQSWKYGERGGRYTELDIGHCLGALRFSAALHGWTMLLLWECSDATLSALLGLTRADAWHMGEREVPDLLAMVIPNRFDQLNAAIDCTVLNDALLAMAGSAVFAGAANQLAFAHDVWPVIETMQDACFRRNPASFSLELMPPGARHCPWLAASVASMDASTIIRQRRSAESMDGEAGAMARDAFFALLSRLMPRQDSVPFDVLRAPACVHVLVWVHRVDAVEPGLYILFRNENFEQVLRSDSSKAFSFAAVDSATELSSFRALETGVDKRRAAYRASCEQSIASHGAFTLAMIADMSVLGDGAHIYRRLHWEAALIGHLVYLEAEANAMRATGIGCFFDNLTQNELGVTDGKGRIQILYHMGVGIPLEDLRIGSEPAYSDERVQQTAAASSSTPSRRRRKKNKI